MDDFRCVAELIGDHSAVVTVKGELDLNTADRLVAVLDDLGLHDGVHLVADLTRCTFIDSTGLGALVRAQNRIATSPLNVAASDIVRRALTLTGLNKAFVVYDTPAEALAALREQVGVL